MHTHKNEKDAKSQKSLLIALFLTLLIMFFELIGGFLSQSLALLSDAGHMLTDSMTLIFAMAAFFVARKISANPKNTYGYHRVEVLAALLNGGILFVVAFAVFFGSIRRFFNPVEINTGIMLVAAIFGFFANMFCLLVLSPHSKENINIKGAFWHILSDTLSSVGVIVAGLIIFFTGFTIIDPILGFVIALLIVKGAYDIVAEAVLILIEATPKDIDFKDITDSIKKIPGVKNLHHVHIWTITSGFRAFSAHVEIEDKMLSSCNTLITDISKVLEEKYNIEHSTIQLECETCEGGLICQRTHSH